MSPKARSDVNTRDWCLQQTTPLARALLKEDYAAEVVSPLEKHSQPRRASSCFREEFSWNYPAVSKEIKAASRESLIACLHTKDQLEMFVEFGLWQASFILSTLLWRVTRKTYV